MNLNNVRGSELQPARGFGGGVRTSYLELVSVFVVSCCLLFLGMSRQPNIYDEGLVLTAAMRVAAGQIPHRDFYANYGPAQFYVLAALFKVFGDSLLIERLYDIFVKALVVTTVYGIALSYCRKRVATFAAVAAILWIFSTNGLAGTPVIPVSLLNLIGVALILPCIAGSFSTTRMAAAGAVAGVATLFRYDTGLALLGIQVCLLAFAVYSSLAIKSLRGLVSTPWISAAWPCLLAFVVVVSPFAFYYLHASTLHPILYDIVLYPSKFYHRGRNLPLPGIHLKYLENFEVYLLIPLIGASFYVAVADRVRGMFKASRERNEAPEEHRWRGFLAAYGLLALLMYFKGVVRMEVPQMYLCIVPSLLLLAVLFEYRLKLSRVLRVFVVGLVSLSGLAVVWATLHEIRRLQVYHFSVPEHLVQAGMETESGFEEAWCKTSTALTRGFCFLADDDRIQTMEFIDSHTAAGQPLYVGLANHDRVFANDNLMYFGAQRLPATMWSHFDPGLQNSAEIQLQMIAELKASAPPYVVIDGEFAAVREPNESSVSTGVTLLDDYIHQAYRPVANFDRMSVWQRTN